MVLDADWKDVMYAKQCFGLVLGFVLLLGSIPLSFSEIKGFSDSTQVTSSDSTEIQPFSDSVSVKSSSLTEIYADDPEALEDARKQKFDVGFYDKIQDKAESKTEFYDCLGKVGEFSAEDIFVYDAQNKIDTTNTNIVNIYDLIKDEPSYCVDLLASDQGKTIGSIIDETEYHTVIVFVTRDSLVQDDDLIHTSGAHENKNKLANELPRSHNATNIFQAETLSFVTSMVPIENIVPLADYGYSVRIGDGELRGQFMLDDSKDAINAEPADVNFFDGTGVTVAVIDSGINQIPHQDLPIGAASTIINQIVCHDTVNGGCPSSGPSSSTNSVYDDDVSGTGHGTHVAGIIAGQGNSPNHDKTGVAPGAQLLNVKVPEVSGGGFTAEQIARAMDWSVTNGARVLNLSLAVNATDGGVYNTVSLSADEAADLGAIVVASAGTNIASSLVIPPATGFNVVAIGTMDDKNDPGNPQNFDIHSSSSEGPLNDGRLKPDIVAPGVAINSPEDGTSTGYSEPTSASSFAAPHVSGSSALLLEAHPELFPLDVKAALIAGSDWHGPTNFFVTSNAYEGGFADDLNDWGFGSLNVEKSLDLIDDGDKIIKDSIKDSQTKTFNLSVVNDQQTKVFLTWLKHPKFTIINPGDVPVSDLSLTVKDSNGNVMAESKSSIQNTEFAIFTPSETSSQWKVEIKSEINRTTHESFVVASTHSLTPNQTVECFPDDLTPYDWIVTRDCTLAKDTVLIAGNVIIDNDATLTIPNGLTLDIDFANKYLLVKDGSKVIVKNGGKID